MALSLPLIILVGAIHCLPCWWLILSVSKPSIWWAPISKACFSLREPVQSLDENCFLRYQQHFFFCHLFFSSPWIYPLSSQLQKTLGSKQGSKSSPHTPLSGHLSISWLPSKFPFFRYFWKPAPSLPRKASPWYSYLESTWLHEDVYFYLKYQPPGTHLKGSHVFRAEISWELFWGQFKGGSSSLTSKKLTSHPEAILSLHIQGWKSHKSKNEELRVSWHLPNLTSSDRQWQCHMCLLSGSCISCLVTPDWLTCYSTVEWCEGQALE